MFRVLLIELLLLIVIGKIEVLISSLNLLISMDSLFSVEFLVFVSIEFGDPMKKFCIGAIAI